MAPTSAGGAVLLDVNALIALHDPQHVHHLRISEWLESNIELGFATCAITQNGCVRVMSQPSYPGPVSVAQALDMLAGSTGSTFHHFWPNDVSLLDDQRFNRAHLHGHRQLTDVYLLGLAVAHQGRLVSFDARIALSSVRGATAEHLLIL
jgi:uncharacterized protein